VSSVLSSSVGCRSSCWRRCDRSAVSRVVRPFRRQSSVSSAGSGTSTAYSTRAFTRCSTRTSGAPSDVSFDWTRHVRTPRPVLAIEVPPRAVDMRRPPAVEEALTVVNAATVRVDRLPTNPFDHLPSTNQQPQHRLSSSTPDNYLSLFRPTTR